MPQGKSHTVQSWPLCHGRFTLSTVFDRVRLILDRFKNEFDSWKALSFTLRMIYKTLKTVRIWPWKLALGQYLTPLLKMAMVGQIVWILCLADTELARFARHFPPHFSRASQGLYSLPFCWHIINLMLVVLQVGFLASWLWFSAQWPAMFQTSPRTPKSAKIWASYKQFSCFTCNSLISAPFGMFLVPFWTSDLCIMHVG